MLSDKSPELKINNDFKINLYPHQKVLLYKMLELYEKNKNKQNSYGFLTNEPSSGKTFVSLSYIYFIKMLNNNNSTNLIVVPNNIYTQWCNSIDKLFINMNVKFLTNNVDINKLYSDKNMLSYDVILTTPIHYLLLSQVVNSIGFKFDNVIFDEADTIKSNLNNKINSSMTWFISASMDNCYNVNNIIIGGYLIDYDLFKNNECYCEPSFVQKSMKIKTPKYEKFICHDFYIDAILSKLNLDESIIKKINSHNFTDLNILCGNVLIENTQDVVKNLYNNINILINSKNENIKEIESKIKFCNQYDYQKYLFNKNKLIDEKNNYDNINNLIKTYSIINNLCIKCFNIINNKKNTNEFKKNIDYYEMPCGNLLCFDCYSQITENIENFDKIKYQCNGCNLNHIRKDMILKNIEYCNMEMHNWDKINLLNDIIKLCNGKTIIFSEYRGIDKHLNKLCFENNLQYLELNGGNILDIDNVMEQFKNDDINILFINDISFGVGLDIEYCKDLIMFSKCNDMITNQVVGRCLRPNRKNRLKIYQLEYKNES